MKRCNPIEMRKNLEIVKNFKLNGIDFVAIPVINEEDKQNFIAVMNEQLDKLLEEVEDV